mmetsp:Transcript_12689/g.32136  ORF Transcript_12689/g.32136 Transcript_12689/m.32136 type:complete len:173 (+) Transcript_12689:95-613(+)
MEHGAAPRAVEQLQLDHLAIEEGAAVRPRRTCAGNIRIRLCACACLFFVFLPLCAAALMAGVLLVGVDCIPLPPSRKLVTPDGRTRCWELDAPEGEQTNRTMPLLIDLHGFMDNGHKARSYSGSLEASLRRGHAVAYPHGHSNSWNAGWCCGPAAEGWDDVDDLRFVTAMLD